MIKGYVLGIAILVGLFFVWGISRHWSCHYNRQDVKALKIKNRPAEAYDVVEVETGTSILARHGRREVELQLWGVAAIPGDVIARDALRTAAGDWVRVEEKGALHPAKPEARKRIVVLGVIYGQTGLCLQLEQLRAGNCRCVGDVPKEWRRAEEEGKKR